MKYEINDKSTNNVNAPASNVFLMNFVHAIFIGRVHHSDIGEAVHYSSWEIDLPVTYGAVRSLPLPEPGCWKFVLRLPIDWCTV